MSDLFEPASGGNAPEFTVSEVSGAIKKVIEGEFGHVRIRGELGRVSRPASGHVYLDLKDDRAVISGVMWKGVASRLKTRPEEGMEVVAKGRLTTFPGQSRYQIIIESLAPAGVGALMAMLEKRKQALAAEGLFDQDRKQPIPYLPRVIGVVTSPSGAVIRDILHRLRDRFPRRVLVWPVAVQGEKCAPEVAAAIEGFNRLTPGGALPRPDVLIVARGGGSIEDLWGFNEEAVVRAVAASNIPVISAVGHETDTTLVDFAADLRAPTPTAAAEHAVPVRTELLGWLSTMEDRRRRALSQALTRRQERLRDLVRALPRPEELVSSQSQRLDHLSQRLPAALRQVTLTGRNSLTRATAGLRPAALDRSLQTRRLRYQGVSDRLNSALKTRVSRQRLRQDGLTARLQPARMSTVLEARRCALSRTRRSFAQVARTRVARLRTELEGLDRLRQSLGYQATLERGFVVVRAGDTLIRSRDAAAEAGALELQFADGRLDVAAGDVPVAAKPVRKSKTKSEDGQGSLF